MSAILAEAIEMLARHKKALAELRDAQRNEYSHLLRKVRLFRMRPERKFEQGDAVFYRDDLYQVLSVESVHVTLFDVYRDDLKFADMRDLMKDAWTLFEGDGEDDE